MYTAIMDHITFIVEQYIRNVWFFIQILQRIHCIACLIPLSFSSIQDFHNNLEH